MAGCRSLRDEEILAVIEALGGKHALRNRALFVLGLNTGFRISELLSLNLGDVYQKQINDRVTVKRRNIKGKIAGRTIALNQITKSTLQPYVQSLLDAQEPLDRPLFFVVYRGKQRMTRKQAWRILQDAFEIAHLQGNLGTHTMRKTFARVMYAALNFRIEKLQRLLGHKWLNSTVSYIDDLDNGLDEAVLTHQVGQITQISL